MMTLRLRTQPEGMPLNFECITLGWLALAHALLADSVAKRYLKFFFCRFLLITRLLRR
ncbi:hypothetical protein EcWSU1_02805 [Enterobacter ludwigii]|uniref:Uncharacterized protein n=1 Tax=Enterobacter ludwigii TaxID=299767 RepID=G8LH31_9ENTR|nr:hypothetical protein EcWSU1_02805 [Enterobacter ludwigii]